MERALETYIEKAIKAKGDKDTAKLRGDLKEASL